MADAVEAFRHLVDNNSVGTVDQPSVHCICAVGRKTPAHEGRLAQLGLNSRRVDCSGRMLRSAAAREEDTI